ncbi:IS701 family transposase [Streptomyces sp. CA-106110]|uniref:IS701 family transposase n=1 Tax=Streptomyces sp. CA-106110 TaxID=3240044 RepID=UPI003D8A1679
MLPPSTVLPSLAGLLEVFRPCFRAPTYRVFAALVVGMIAQTGRHTVCGMLLGAGLGGVWHHARAHRFFSAARWSADRVGLALAQLIADLLLPPAAALEVAVDETFFRRRGKKIFGVLWGYDGSVNAPKPLQVGWGHCWVIADLVAHLPGFPRPICLPVLLRLWGGKGTASRVQLARTLVELLARAFPDRTLHVVADGAYATHVLRGLPERITWTTRAAGRSVFYRLPSAPTGRRGRPRLKGDRLGTSAGLAARARFRPCRTTCYGHTATVRVAETLCLWYGVFGPGAARVLNVRDPAARGKDLTLVTTDLASTAAALVSRYAGRWSIEVAVFDGKQFVGAGQARNRTRAAVERTVPFAVICTSLIPLWYSQFGDRTADVADHRRAAPWYTTKKDPSFEDMLAALRRVVIAARFNPLRAEAPTATEILQVQHAWASAAA